MIAEIRRIAGFIASHPIGRRAKGRCWRRVLAWQFGSRLLPFPVHLPWIGETCLVTERGMTGATGNWYCGLHEFADMALLLHYFGAAGEPDGFLDVGANVGSYTVLASGVCGQQSLALEPVPASFRKLERNLRANRITGLVDARCMAAGPADGKIRFSCDRDTMNQVVGADYAGDVMDVPVATLDGIFEQGAPVPAFWKVDVEGFEKEVLAGGGRSLRNPGVKVVLLEADEPGIASTMEAHGFRRVAYDPFTRTVHSDLGVVPGNNHLWVKEADEVQRRCRASRPIDVMGLQI